MDTISEHPQPAATSSITTQPPPVPQPQPTPTPDSQQPADEPTTQTSPMASLAALNEAEKYWTWKAGLRAIICILSIVAIGCAAGLISGDGTLTQLSGYYFADFSGWIAGVIATLCVSFAWCFLAILLPFFLKPRRPLHPGIAVGIDLVFWLGFIVLGLFTLVAVFEAANFGQYGVISDYNYNSNYQGNYVLAPNNTWFYNITYVRTDDTNPIYNYTTGQYEYPPLNTTGVVRDCTPMYATCAEQDAAVNAAWNAKPRLFALSVVVNAVEWLCLLIYFALFVWACVDTHRYNSRLTKGKEQIVADRIIADLEKKGLITVTDGVVQPIRTGRPEVVVAGPSH